MSAPSIRLIMQIEWCSREEGGRIFGSFSESAGVCSIVRSELSSTNASVFREGRGRDAIQRVGTGAGPSWYSTVMETRTLGRSGLVVSAIGLGCMGVPEFYGQGDNPAASLAADPSAR